MKNALKRNKATFTAAAVIAQAVASVALAGTSTNSTNTQLQGLITSGPNAGQGVPAITISLSGQTALGAFTGGPGISTLQPGGSITFNFSALGGPSSVTYTASNTVGGYTQLAALDFTSNDTATGVGIGSQSHSALRVEWHQQGSVQGLIDLINDQVGYYTTGNFGDSTFGVAGSISSTTGRAPQSTNVTTINSATFSAGGTSNGFGIGSGNFNNTYNQSVYDLPTGRNKSSGSFGGQSGQDRIQIAVGEFKIETVSKSGGTPSPIALPGGSGYGQGNPALQPAANTIGLGIKGGRQQLYNEAILNQATDKVNPQSPTGATYAQGPWNDAGADNLDSRQIAVTAVTLSANPGTGLSKLNRTDAQWIQAAGRLKNGADFNAVTRANDAGQRIVPAVNAGLDPSWAVGENDDGDTSTTSATNVQRTLGPAFRLSGKTAGGASRDAIVQSRLGIGPLSIAEARGTSNTTPLRVLQIAWNNTTDQGASFTLPSFDNIVGSVNFGTVNAPNWQPKYAGVLISHYNTIKAANPTLLANYRSTFQIANGRLPTTAEEKTWWAGLSSKETGIKGDVNKNVEAFITNITNSIGTGANTTATSANNPADALFASGFLIPGLLDYKREFDGGPLSPNTPNLTIQSQVGSVYGPNFGTNAQSSNTSTIGSGATYGARNAGTVLLNAGSTQSFSAAISVPVPITAQNYLFGNFNQDGKRDYASVKESVNAALSLRQVDAASNVNARSSIYDVAGGVPNNTTIPSLLNASAGWSSGANTKGDLIVLGDFNSDAAFDGADLYLLARGASLSDNPNAANPSATRLTSASGTTLDEQLRNPLAKLNKNGALNDIDTALNNAAGTFAASVSFLRKTASANLTNDPNGQNAFNKYDVNRDGLVNRKDAAIVDKFVTKKYNDFDHVLAATIANDGSVNPALPQLAISLVDVELDDNVEITYTLAGGTSDFKKIRDVLADITNAANTNDVLLRDGDANFDGQVNTADFTTLAQNFNTTGHKWSEGDFNYDGRVNALDFNGLATNFGLAPVGGAVPTAALGALVPEPGSLGVLIATCGLSLSRKRRARGSR